MATAAERSDSFSSAEDEMFAAAAALCGANLPSRLACATPTDPAEVAVVAQSTQKHCWMPEDAEPTKIGQAKKSGGHLGSAVQDSGGSEVPLLGIQQSPGASGAPYQITGCALGFFLQIYLLDVAQLDPFYASIILFVGRAWDAVTDPLVGFFISKTSWSRFGRLMPWVLVCEVHAVHCPRSRGKFYLV
ncbi:UNVERIFIED_CONTAM: hypothetical protein K2H54_049696 [Gekko kuhli]